MGVIWNSAKVGEGRQLAWMSNITWVIVFIAAICHGFWRFFSGRPMLGDSHRKTDAEWSKPGLHKLNPKGRTPGWWSRATERRRAGIRCACLLILIDIVWDTWSGLFGGSFIHALFTIAAFVLIWTGLYLITANVVKRFRGGAHEKDLLRPMRKTIAGILGVMSPDDVIIRMPHGNTRGDVSE
jgi:hypothetical protein